jgi:predicted  nucleic acid-binding Zn-ribbon protein
MNQAFHMARLQRIDLQIDQFNGRIKEIDRLLSEIEAIRQAEDAVRQAEIVESKARQRLKVAENAVEAQRIKIETNESALYAGKIRNPKELQDLQNDIASRKRNLAELEDEQLEAMLFQEDAEEKLKNCNKELDETRARIISQNATLAGEKAKIQDSLLRLIGERDAALKPLTSESISLYQHLREQKHGIAVATVEDGACSACGTELRPAELQAARSPHNVVFCASCGRILYTG